MDNAEYHKKIFKSWSMVSCPCIQLTNYRHWMSVIFGFKTFMRTALNDHALMNPNKHITLHLLPEFVSKAWTSAATSSNILASFRSTGIWPINRNIFTDANLSDKILFHHLE